MSSTKRPVRLVILAAFSVLWMFMPANAWTQDEEEIQAPKREFQERKFSTTSLKEYRDNPDYHYSREKPEPLKQEKKEKAKKDYKYRPVAPPAGPRGDFSGVAKGFFWVVIVVMILVIVYQVYKVGFKDVVKKKSDTAVVEIPDEEDVDDIRNMEFENLVQEAVNQKRYRHAVRLLYLNSLRQLQDRSLIQWKKDKTNRDYLRELKDQNLFPHFNHLTFLFEYIWYGEFPVDQNHFTLARTGFMEFDQAIRQRDAK